MRHKPAGGMALTLGTYGDAGALLERKCQAIDQLERWVTSQRKDRKKQA